MATGSGKTRTVIALCDLLMKANWAKRVLFLADRTALVKQAVGAFKQFLPESSPVNLVTERHAEGRICVSTYPTMVGLIDSTKGDLRRFGVGHFDLVIIDEAHRSVFMKYRSIFEYFDSLLVGLTATPKDEIDRNTYRLFDLEDGSPTDAYTLEEAVKDGFLLPSVSISVPLRLPSQGITYDQLSEEEKEHFEITDWKERAEDVLGTGRVEAAAINQWLFNADTVDKVLKHLMERGQKVDGGDKLGKTIIFARNHHHAEFIAKRFDANYQHLRGHFAQVIDVQNPYAQDLIDKFSDPTKTPQIAISVDMLDTGIDVPEVVNLVFFKPVRSKTKFWQMVGRGTRLCKDLFGPGQDKKNFFIFDYCGNLEFFQQQMETSDGNASASLSKRLFSARLKLIAAIAHSQDGGKVVREHVAQYGEPRTDKEVMQSIVELLKADVAAMNLENFIVRAKRRMVEKYQSSDTWLDLDESKLAELEHEIAGLPTDKAFEPVEAKLFDLLLLRLQMATLTAKPGFARLKKQLQDVAHLLEEASSIPVIRDQLPLIQDLQGEEWWEGVTVPMLELVRLRLRGLIHLAEKKKGSPVYTDFEDAIAEETEVTLPGLGEGASLERFREKARAFLLKHLDRESIQKLRLNEPLTEADLRDLESILLESGVGSAQEIRAATQPDLCTFVRSLVGMDREAAKAAFGQFLSGGEWSGNQIQFINLIIDTLTEHGTIDARTLYESPFTDFHTLGLAGLFAPPEIEAIVRTIRSLQLAPA